MFRSSTRASLALVVLAGNAVLGVSTSQAASPQPVAAPAAALTAPSAALTARNAALTTPSTALAAPNAGPSAALAAPNAGPAAALAEGTVGIEKSVVGLTGAARPGSGFSYQLTASCSSLTVACVGATVSDVIPAGLALTVPPSSSRSQTVTYNAATRLLTITFTQPLPPPNPVGSTGLPAGSVSKVYVGVQLPAATTAADGSVITNTATITAVNAIPASDSAAVTVSIPRRVTPVANKSWPDGNSVAQSGEQTDISVGVANNSSRSAQVSTLTVTDASAATFDTHDLVSLGPVLRFPAGSDQVTVGVCTQPVGTACTAAQWIDGPVTAGPVLVLPPGVSPAAVTGVRFVFSSSTGAVLPPDPAGGQVQFTVLLRNTIRSTGALLDPTTTLTNSNCAVPAAQDPVAGTVLGTPSCVPFSVFPRATSVAVSKQYFSDPSGNFVASGVAVAGQQSPVSALTQVINTAAFPVGTVTVTEPSASTPSDFSSLNVTALLVQFPSGAQTATLTVSCRDGSVPPAVSLTSPPVTAKLASTGCGSSFPSRISVTFTGSGAQGQPSIAAGAVAKLGVHGTLNSGAVVGQSSNCADGLITSGSGGQGSAAGVGCANLTVAAPTTRVSGTKSASSTRLVPGVPVTFTVRASNAGTLPQASFEITDPPAPTAAGNPFDVIAITGARLTSAPSTLSASLAIQLYDPTSASWVAYDPTNAALLTAARGIRVVLVSGFVPAGATIQLVYSAVVRPGAGVNASVLNCQLTSASAGGVPATASACASQQTVTAPSTSGAVQKVISPATVARSLAGVPPQTSQVRLQARNTGNIALKRIVVTDSDAAFFDAVNLTGVDAVNFPPGANRVQVDACTTDCANGTFIAGVAGTTAVLPAGITPGQVQGLRFTFSNSSGAYSLTPGSNFPVGGPCPLATVCFHVAPRVTLRSSPATPVPDVLSNTATAEGESVLQPAGATYPFGSATAPLTLVQGTPQLDVNKTPASSAAGAGNPIPFTLTVHNSGTAVVPDLVVVDPVPTGLVFDQSYAGGFGLPFTVNYTVPLAIAPRLVPIFSLQRGDPAQPDRITELRWTFPGLAFLPGSTIELGYQDTLAPGFSAGSTETNVFGAGSADVTTQQALLCTINSSRDGQVVNGAYGPGRFCTSSAQVLSRGGTDVDAQKWVTGDASLGFYNSITNIRVTPGDARCPLFIAADGRQYTRYPCIAQVLAGHNFEFALRVINVGNTPVTQVRLADGLPHVGDTGVKLTDEQRGTQWIERPRLAAAPTLDGPGTVDFSYSSDPQVCTAQLASPPGVCPAGAWNPTYSPDALGFEAFVTFPARLQPGASFTIHVAMQAPPTLTNPAGALPIAWNSFAHTDFVLEPGQTVPVQLPLVEPPKVGIALPFGSLLISKQVTGGAGNPATAGPFQAAYSCTVTPTGSTAVIVASGGGAFNVGSPLAVANIPVGAQCSVWETVTGGAQSLHTSLATALTVTISATSAATTVTLVNTFSAVDAAAVASLSVTKRVINGGAGPYSFTLVCTLAGVRVDLPTATAAFTLSADQTRVFSVPAGAVCTVTEVNKPSLDVVSYGGSATPVAVTVTGGQTQTITNQFPRVAIAAPPPPRVPVSTTTPPASTAPTSTAPGSSTNAPPPPPPSQVLAATGSNVRTQLVWVLWCWVLGASLVIAVRRRRVS